MLRPVLPRLVLCAALLAGAFPVSLLAQSGDALLDQAVEAFRRGDDEAASTALRQLLASDPGHEQAYQLLQRVDDQMLREMLVSRGEIGALAERFLGLAKVGRRVVLSDPGGAADLVEQALSGNVRERVQAVLELQANYGEWAVPALTRALGDRADPDRRVRAIQALLQLGDVAVVPLTEVLDAEDELVRTNAASVLGASDDPRAAAALAWMASSDPAATARQVAADALARLRPALDSVGLGTSDPLTLTLGLSRGWLTGRGDLVKPYAQGGVAWSWEGGQLVGTPIFGGLYTLSLAESTLQRALRSGADGAARELLAAVHAAMKAEILHASAVDTLADDELLAAAQEQLQELELQLALAGPHRARALLVLMEADQPAAASALAASMEASRDEQAALRSALGSGHESISMAAALTLARQGDASSAVVGRLASALGRLPARLAMSIGDTGLAGGMPGWELISARAVADGLLRAKAFPPKDVIVVQDGVQNVTLDTLVFGLKNDPRTAHVPLVVVTSDPGRVESLFGDRVEGIVERASWEAVSGVASDRDTLQQAALTRAIAAAEALSRLPVDALGPVAGPASEALASGADDGVLVAVLDLVRRGRLLSALSAVETLLSGSASRDVQVAAMRAAGTLWAVNGGPTSAGEALRGTLDAALQSGDHELALAAASALGQLGAGGAVGQS